MTVPSPMERAPVVLATGGTGGHVFPAQAVAAELRRRGCRVVVFTDERGAAFEPEVEVFRIRAASPARSVAGMAGAAVDIAAGCAGAWRLLRRLRPAAVLGFGGYASVPTMLAASWLRLPSLIHEQNAVLGRANRLVAPRVHRIATAFERVEAVRPRDAGKLTRTGNPVRRTVAAVRDRAYAPPQSGAPFRLLVLGGSQGARVFSEVVPPAVAGIPAAMRQGLRIVQQCRPEDLESVRAAYAAAGIEAELATFFHDVPERLAAAHLLIVRAGASTVAEVTAAGRPAILVPYPFAMDDHQTANARALEEAGAAWLMPQRAFTAEALAARIEGLLASPEPLVRLAAAAAAAGRVDAAERLADLVEGELRTGGVPADRRSDMRGMAA